jgi:hypothetical protein
MDYKQASLIYAQQLKTALDIRRHALALANLSAVGQLGISTDEKNKLRNAGEPCEKLMNRLQKGEFRIAVVGLEKAGKSTFVNAWLGSDLLPAKPARCTFTTTQIYSVQHESEQRLETLPKTSQLYETYKSDLRLQTESPDRGAAQKAENDLHVMQQHEKTLNEVISEGKKTFAFSRLEDIKIDLNRYVADERYAHAMQEARLFTSKLAAVDGVVFYDVPGLDSGLAKHIEESKEMLADCDAIILVQRRDIDLKAHEQDLIKFGQRGDPYLKLSDKLFVFWGQIDLQPSKEILEENWKLLLEKWSAESIPAHRIVRGSAGSHLVLHGCDLPQIGSLEQVTLKIKQLTDLESPEELKKATGIIELKYRIQKYLDEERTNILKIRCDGMIKDILIPANEIYKTVAAVYPEDPESAKRKQEFDQGVEFSEWWGKRWQKIQADVNNRFKEGNEASLQNRQKFCERYGELVKEKMNALPSRQLDRRQEIFDSVSNPVFDSVKANIDWREALYSDVRKMIKDLAHNLAVEIQKEALGLIKELEAQLWHSDEIKPRLLSISDEIYVSLLEHSLNTLFLRFARPVSELLIRGAVSSETRHAIREKIGNDIEILDNYYSGGEPALERLKQYANHGVKLLIDDKKRKEVLGASAKVVEVIVGKNPFANIAFHAAKVIASEIELPKVNKQDDVIEEVEADIRVLEHYLIHGIFEASGFSAFCQQELENLRDSFMEKGSTWNGVTHGEWQKGNPELLKELPYSLQSFQFDTEISDNLKQLRLALNVDNMASY